jgi:hypothetical protein
LRNVADPAMNYSLLERMGMLVRIAAPHFVAGILLDAQERCVRAAPIVAWAVGLDREALRKEFRLRGWRASVIGEGASPRHPLLAVIDEVQEGA